MVAAGQTWHWIDPVAGAAKAAEALAAHGRLAAFWSVFEPLAEAFAAVRRRVLPDTPVSRGVGGVVGAYAPILIRAADGINAAGAFDQPEQWRFD